MKSKKKSPPKLKQSKITLFCSKLQNNNAEESTSAVNKKKRKNEEILDFQKTPKKIAIHLYSESPGSIGVAKKNDVENTCMKIYSTEDENSKENQVHDGRENDVNEWLNCTNQTRSPQNQEKSPRKVNSSPLKVLDVIDSNNITVNKNEVSFGDFENDLFVSFKELSPKKNSFVENSLENDWILEKSELNFENPTKCKILKSVIITKGRYEQVLLVQDVNLEKKGICKLRDVWTFSSILLNDIVVIQSVESEEGWVIDNNVGYIILYPDIIISSTSLVRSMYCMRQGLLSNFYKGVETGNNSKMLIGRLVHELLQECLKSRSCSEQGFSSIIKRVLSSPDYLRDIYFSGMTSNQIEEELKTFVPRVRNFLDIYVNKKLPPKTKNFNGTIESILDIEELIRSSNLGLQGRIDATVTVNHRNSSKTVPLELKTGRASFSLEHKSQVVLYVLLMNELGRKVESGLLLYLKEETMEEIMPHRDDIRNLFLMRNQLVRYYKTMRINNLPDPIRNIKGCEKCSYLRICKSYLKNDEYELYPLRNIEMPDIKPSHIEFFMKWNKMLWLEFEGIFDEGDDYKISGLQLLQNTNCDNGEMIHTFLMGMKLNEKILQPGTFVYVVNEKSNYICSGRIIEMTSTSCLISADKKLENYLDSYTIVVYKSKFLNFYMSNLGIFLDEKFEHLRELIIDKKLPTFQRTIDKKDFKEKCLEKLMTLNKEQQKAVLKSLLCNDYLLIKGPPGTGKTQTIATLVRVLIALDQSVLIASHTHSSIDNILGKLEDVEFLRLGSLKSINKKIHHKCYASLIKSCSSAKDIEKLFQKKVIAATCAGIDSDFVENKNFDVCIIDESSQVLQPEVLRPLFCCKKFILVGDEDQLPPVVQNPDAKKLGMDVSMFELLTNESAVITLKYQYRMNSVINALANALTYNGSIECANKEVAEATINITNLENHLKSDDWIFYVLSDNLEKSVIFIDTSNCFANGSTLLSSRPRSSVLEANIVVTLVSHLIKFGLAQNNIGVIAPFWDQIELLKKKLNDNKLLEIELNTVDQYQGRDKEVIFLSCGKENQGHKEATESELLNDKRRLTVAVSRAKHKLVIVGDKHTIVKYKPFQKLLNSLNDSQCISLIDGKNNFLLERFIN